MIASFGCNAGSAAKLNHGWQRKLQRAAGNLRYNAAKLSVESSRLRKILSRRRS
jgi:hypothetical protein